MAKGASILFVPASGNYISPLHTRTNYSRRQAMLLPARKVRTDSVGAESHIAVLGSPEEEARKQTRREYIEMRYGTIERVLRWLIGSHF